MKRTECDNASHNECFYKQFHPFAGLCYWLLYSEHIHNSETYILTYMYMLIFLYKHSISKTYFCHDQVWSCLAVVKDNHSLCVSLFHFSFFFFSVTYYNLFLVALCNCELAQNTVLWNVLVIKLIITNLTSQCDKGERRFVCACVCVQIEMHV